MFIVSVTTLCRSDDLVEAACFSSRPDDLLKKVQRSSYLKSLNTSLFVHRVDEKSDLFNPNGVSHHHYDTLEVVRYAT